MSKVVRSTTNPGVKQVVKLRNARARRQTGLFAVEGFREIRRALVSEAELVELWVCPDLYLGTNEQELVDLAAGRGAEVIEVAPEPFRKMSYRDRPEGLLAVCKQLDVSLERLSLSGTPLVLVVEGIEKPGNLGAMIRTAAAAGSDAVVVADQTTDVFNPNVVRASIGTLFTLPVAVCSSPEAMTFLDRHGLRTCASTPSAALDLWQAPLHEGVAIVVGAEQYGLSKQWLDKADVLVRIPMPGEDVDSLNASASAAVLLFEAVRQRSL